MRLSDLALERPKVTTEDMGEVLRVAQTADEEQLERFIAHEAGRLDRELLVGPAQAQLARLRAMSREEYEGLVFVQNRRALEAEGG